MYNNRKEKDNVNVTFIKIVEDLLNKADGNLLTLNPLKDKPKELLMKLLSLAQIKRPDEEFVFSISE
jgi:hypothetical protein